MRNRLKTFFLSGWTVGEKSLLLADILLFGVLVGWLTSPLKGRPDRLSGNFAGFDTTVPDQEDMEGEKEEET